MYISGPCDMHGQYMRIVTGSQSPSSLWLILVNPVVKMFPSLVKMALIGRIPSCGARRSCWSVQGRHHDKSYFFFNLLGVYRSCACGPQHQWPVHNHWIVNLMMYNIKAVFFISKASFSNNILDSGVILLELIILYGTHLLVFHTHLPQPPPSCGGRRHADACPCRWCKTSCRFGSRRCCRLGLGGRPWRWWAPPSPRSRL